MGGGQMVDGREQHPQGVEGRMYARSAGVGLDAGRGAGRPGCGVSKRRPWDTGYLTFLRTCCSLAEWAFTCLRRELGSV